MTAAPFARRGSFFETWRLFSGGATRAWLVTLIMFPAMAMPFWMASHGKAILFAPLALIIVTCFGFATWQFEGEMADRTAFMMLVPQPVDTRRLVLVPMCAIGIVVAVALAAFTRLPAAAALASLGVAWWTIASTRWVWKLRLWSLVAWPVLLAGPAIAYATQRFAGWGAAAAVSMPLAIAALAFQPRAYVGETLSRMQERGGAGAAIKAPARRGTPLATAAGHGLLASSWRLLAFSFSGSPGVSIVVSSALLALMGLAFPFIGRRLDVLLWAFLLVLARLPSVQYGGDMHEFLHPRPLRNGPRVLAGVVFPILLVLIVPAAGLCFTIHDWIETGGVIPQLLGKPRPPSEDDIRYMREILGATFLPAQWPAGGLPEPLWAQLRPLLVLDVLRTALLVVTMLFGLSPLPKAGEKPGHGSTAVATVVAFLVIAALFARVEFLETFARWPVPRLWFLALLAAAAVAHWSWRAHRLNAPPRAASGDAKRASS